MITDIEADHLRQALGELLRDTGLDTPSLRALATAAGVTHGSLRNWFGTKEALHLRVFEVVAERFASILAAGVLPDPRDSWSADRFVADLRLRLAFAELARTDQVLARALGRLEHRERRAIVMAGRITGPRRLDDEGPSVDSDEVRLLHAALLGLWSGLVRAADPLDLAEARRLWDHALTMWIAPEDTRAAG